MCLETIFPSLIPHIFGILQHLKLPFVSTVLMFKRPLPKHTILLKNLQNRGEKRNQRNNQSYQSEDILAEITETHWDEAVATEALARRSGSPM